MNYYRIYHLSFATELVLPGVDKSEYDPKSILLTYSYNCNIKNEANEIRITANNDGFMVDLRPFAVYTISKQHIHVVAAAFEAIYSTLFNIPLSVYVIAFTNSFILHASTLHEHGRLFDYETIAFCCDIALFIEKCHMKIQWDSVFEYIKEIDADIMLKVCLEQVDFLFPDIIPAEMFRILSLKKWRKNSLGEFFASVWSTYRSTPESFNLSDVIQRTVNFLFDEDVWMVISGDGTGSIQLPFMQSCLWKLHAENCSVCLKMSFPCNNQYPDHQDETLDFFVRFATRTPPFMCKGVKIHTIISPAGIFVTSNDADCAEKVITAHEICVTAELCQKEIRFTIEPFGSFFKFNGNNFYFDVQILSEGPNGSNLFCIGNGQKYTPWSWVLCKY